MLRKTVFAALVGLALPAHAFDLNSMSAEEKEAFGQAVREYLLENPETIFEAVEVFRQREAQAEAAADLNLVAANADAIFNDGFSYVGGNPEGDITVVEFMDYRCGGIDQGRRQHPFYRQRIPRSWRSIGNGIGLCGGGETIARGCGL